MLSDARLKELVADLLRPVYVHEIAQALLEARDLVEDLASSLRDVGGIQDVHGPSALGRAADALDRADAMRKARQP